MFDFLLFLVHTDLRMKSLTCESISINSISPIYMAYHFVTIWHPFHFEGKSCLNSSFFSSFILFHHLYLLRSFAFHIYDFRIRFIRLNSDGNIPLFPMSHATWNWKPFKCSDQVEQSFDIILSIIMNCYHIMINIYVFAMCMVHGLMYDLCV